MDPSESIDGAVLLESLLNKRSSFSDGGDNNNAAVVGAVVVAAVVVTAVVLDLLDLVDVLVVVICGVDTSTSAVITSVPFNSLPFSKCMPSIE